MAVTDVQDHAVTDVPDVVDTAQVAVLLAPVDVLDNAQDVRAFVPDVGLVVNQAAPDHVRAVVLDHVQAHVMAVLDHALELVTDAPAAVVAAMDVPETVLDIVAVAMDARVVVDVKIPATMVVTLAVNQAV